VKFQALHQPSEIKSERNILDCCRIAVTKTACRISPDFRACGWRGVIAIKHGGPFVLPPRGPAQRRGLFATRSPHRPESAWVDAVPLLGVDGLKLILGECTWWMARRSSTSNLFPPTTLFRGRRWLDGCGSAEFNVPPQFSVCLSRCRDAGGMVRANWQIDFSSAPV